jgi:hypothetical protein
MLLSTFNRQTGVWPGEPGAQPRSEQIETPQASDLSYGAVDWFMYVAPINPPSCPDRTRQGSPRTRTRSNQDHSQ